VEAFVSDLLEFLSVGVITLPTIAMSAWPKGRRFAHLPLVSVVVAVGWILSFRMGEFVRASALNPGHYRCGLPIAIPTLFLLLVGAWLVLAGVALLFWPETRKVGRRVLLWGVLGYGLACVSGAFVGRHFGS
jgi:hypothetical protein